MTKTIEQCGNFIFTDRPILNPCKENGADKLIIRTYLIMIARFDDMMIDSLYNYRVVDIHSAEFSDEFNKLCLPFEDSLSEAQIDVFHKILDCVSETAAAETRAAYKAGFKDGVALMREVQE